VIQRVISGEVNLFSYLVLKYLNYVFNVVEKHIPHNWVEEIAHEVFVKAYQSLATFKHKGDFKHWLTAIAIKTCYAFWRKEYRRCEIPMNSCAEEDRDCLKKIIAQKSNQATREENFRQEIQELLNHALARLSPEERLVLEMAYFEGLPIKKVANLLGWTVVRVKVSLFRSRKKLRNIISRWLKE
ncbi:MAG: sigma-70 family RNA polymerase sigma factor, partial [Desulfobacterota bacterium]|nr:sigma-70 family RNA polymerase sigma factor [Thermodesulfobacteriota bacterium]